MVTRIEWREWRIMGRISNKREKKIEVVFLRKLIFYAWKIIMLQICVTRIKGYRCILRLVELIRNYMCNFMNL